MAFADKKSLGTRTGGIAGAIAVHTGLAALLIAGLTVGGYVRTETGPLVANTFPTPPPPPPDPKPDQDKHQTESTIIAPLPPKPIPQDFAFKVDPVIDPPYSDEIRLHPLPPLDPPGVGSTRPATLATPRNHAESWVTDNDYKPRWVREGMYGSASFRLDVAANGRVENCRITRSTGHDALDKATCDLIAKRARFNPAKDGTGNAIAGSYSGAIDWVLPD